MVKKWLRYYRKGLADTLAVDINLRDLDFVDQLGFDPAGGSIDVATTAIARLFTIQERRHNKKRGITKKDNPKWETLDTIPLYVSLTVLQPTPERGVYAYGREEKIPFWYRVICDREGRLSPPDETFPLVQRKYLVPLADERTSWTFGKVSRVDKAVSVPLVASPSYAEYVIYLQLVFLFISGKRPGSYETEGHQRIDKTYFALPEDEIGAAAAIIDLYAKTLARKESISTLPATSAVLTPQVKATQAVVRVADFMAQDFRYLGHMSARYALSLTQRKAIYTFGQSSERVFPVNGPPGTGKTTLLQNVVANALVHSALAGGGPAIILACSNNNQAVTNIIDSFASAADDEDLRWIPGVAGIGTYLPGSTKSAAELRGYNFKKTDRSGLFATLEQGDALDECVAAYYERANAFFGVAFRNLGMVTDALRERIKTKSEQIKVLPPVWSALLAEEERFREQRRRNFASADAYYLNGRLQQDKLRESRKQLVQLETALSGYYEAEGFWRKLLVYVGYAKAIRAREQALTSLFRDQPIALRLTPKFSREEVTAHIQESIKSYADLLYKLRAWTAAKESLGLVGDPPRDEPAYQKAEFQKATAGGNCQSYFDELDVTIRHQLYRLAVNYWEGRYLQAALDKGDENRGRAAVMAQWERHAMLTPCFVSTFYMAPKFFSYSKFIGKNDAGAAMWGDGTLYNFLDLLIIDEAGQVAPEIGVASFALAKKALIVGDVKQIEPIHNLSKPIDLGNLKEVGLIKNYASKLPDETYGPQGFLSSSGNLMQLALTATGIGEDDKSKGITLLEHRRCYNEIIAYCNKLAYGGRLVPFRGPAPRRPAFPPMQLLHVEGRSETRSKSRYNAHEAHAIGTWLTQNAEAIRAAYPRLTVEECVGIVTPFTSQKNSIRASIKAAGFKTDAMKIGTVHTLQGAERPIVIFSMVYGPGEVGTMFFDRGVNMLNVAVSRAKDSFIVFANKAIFAEGSGKPSSLLYQYLRE